MKSTILLFLWMSVFFQVQARTIFTLKEYVLTAEEILVAQPSGCQVSRSLGFERSISLNESQAAPVQWEYPTDKKIVGKLRKKINARKKNLAKKIDKYAAKAKKKLTNRNEKKSAVFLAKAKEARLGYAEMQQAEMELTKLENSPEKITFLFNEENISYTYMDSNRTIIIEFNSYVNAIHELTHVYQHLTGEIEYLAGTGGAGYIDLLDELKAYRRQYFFAPYSFNKLRSDAYIKIRKSANIRRFWIAAIYFMKQGKKYYPYKGLKSFPVSKPKE